MNYALGSKLQKQRLTISCPVTCKKKIKRVLEHDYTCNCNTWETEKHYEFEARLSHIQECCFKNIKRTGQQGGKDASHKAPGHVVKEKSFP